MFGAWVWKPPVESRERRWRHTPIWYCAVTALVTSGAWVSLIICSLVLAWGGH